MCCVGFWPKLTLKPRVAYKVLKQVTEGKFKSPVDPSRRSQAKWSRNVGRNLTYVINQTTHSPGGPGIFCYEQKVDALAHAHFERADGWPDTLVVVEVEIPAFTVVRRGSSSFGDVLAAGRLKVVKLIA